MNWSKQQTDIFNWCQNAKPNSNLVIDAVAGSGKTTTLREGFNHCPEKKILYAVFGKRNQLEAVEKIKNSRVDILTLHSLGLSYIKSIWPKAHVPRSGQWFFEVEKIKSICKEFPDQYHFMIIKLVSFLKNNYLTPTLDNAKDMQALKGLEINGKDKNWNDKIPEIALDMIARSLVQDNWNRITFDDMVWLPNSLNLVTPRYDMSAVDETQDMNVLQLEMAIKATKQNGRICLIGDAQQCVFGFRGALQNGIEIFKQKLNAETLPLTVSYRCPKKVIASAKILVPKIEAAENAPEGELVKMTFENAINQLKVNDVVLSRKNAPLMPVALKLLRKKVATYILGKDIGKQLISIIKGLEANDIYDFGNKLQAWHDAKITTLTGKKYANERIDLMKDQFDMLKELADECLKQSRNSVQDIIYSINNLFYDEGGVKYPAVTCSSVHKAKGLEWPTVYLLEDTLYVSHPLQTANDKQEERNIHYVAITRSQNKLVLVEGLGQRVNP